MKLRKRVLRKFDVIGISGRGGHSRVYKLRHIPTNKFHALKEVGIVSRENIDDVLFESKLLGPKHKNILSYQSLMISTRPKELEQIQEEGEPESRPSSGIDIDLIKKCSSLKIKVDTRKDKKYYHYLLSDHADFTLRDYIDLRNELFYKEETERCMVFNSQNDKIFECKIPYYDSENRFRQIPAIFMSYSIIKTGREKLVNRHFVNFIFKGILKGLCFLHSKSIIHNDLKPSNIFFVEKEDYSPKIGDFGLSKKEFRNFDSLHLDDRSFLEKGDWLVNMESEDVFNVGLVYFEMLWPMKTVSERYYTLRDIKDRNAVPAEFSAELPDEARIIEQCINPNTFERPSARRLLRDVCALVRTK